MCYHQYTEKAFWCIATINYDPLMLFLLCRLEMGTWFVCGSWLENAWLNMPPPNVPGLTARGFAGLFREELHVSWSTATTRSLIFPPYLSQLIKPGGINWWPFYIQRNLTTVPKYLLWLGVTFGWLLCSMVTYLQLQLFSLQISIDDDEFL